MLVLDIFAYLVWILSILKTFSVCVFGRKIFWKYQVILVFLKKNLGVLLYFCCDKSYHFGVCSLRNTVSPICGFYSHYGLKECFYSFVSSCTYCFCLCKCDSNFSLKNCFFVENLIF